MAKVNQDDPQLWLPLSGKSSPSSHLSPSPCFIASRGRGMMAVLCQFQEVMLMSHSQHSKGKFVSAFCNARSTWQHWKKTKVYPVVQIWARVRQHQWRWKTSKCCVTQVGKVWEGHIFLLLTDWHGCWSDVSDQNGQQFKEKVCRSELQIWRLCTANEAVWW